MDIFQIKYFLELKEHEHMSITAELLNISQPALSRSISSLEAELGVQLFDRFGKRIKLNHNGEEFSKYAEKAVHFLEQGISSVKKLRYEVTGKITILAYAYAPILGNCISSYAQMNPHVQFVVSQFALGGKLKQSETPDFILCGSGGSPTFDQEQFWVEEPLQRTDYVLAASNRLIPLDPERTSISPSELKETPFITMMNRSIFFQDFTFQICQNAGFFPQSVLETDNYSVQMEFVRQGLGVAIFPSNYIQYLKTPSSDISVYKLDNCSYCHTLSLLRRKKSQMSESAQDFWDYVLSSYNRPEDQRL